MTVTWDTDLGVHHVHGFEEASQVLRGSGWSSDPRNSPLAPPEFKAMPQGTLLFLDPPDHTRLRRFLSPAFTPRAIETLRPRIAAVVEAALDGLEDDLLDFAYLVPLAVIAELLDVGAEGAQVFQEQTPHLVRLLEIDASPDDLEAATAASLEVTMFLLPVLQARRDDPGADFISVLLAGDLTLEEVALTCILLLAAGHETTANLVANSTYTLLTRPDQLPHLFADPTRAIEELLRFESPVKLAARTAMAAHTIGGRTIEPGQAAVLHLARANRDPRRWTTPDELDLTRPGPPHLALGGGAHFCLGAALAKLEAEETLTRLFTRYPRLALTEEPTWRPSTTFRALSHVGVTTA